MRIDKKTISFEHREPLGCDILRLMIVISDRAKTSEQKHVAIEVVVDPFDGLIGGEIIGLAGALDRMSVELRNSLSKGKFTLKKAK